MAEEKKKLADELMEILKGRINEIAELNEGWGKAINITFHDIRIGYWIKFAMDGTVEKMEKRPISEIGLGDAEATVHHSTVQVLKDTLDKKLSGGEAMGTGQVWIEGKMEALMKLAPALE